MQAQGFVKVILGGSAQSYEDKNECALRNQKSSDSNIYVSSELPASNKGNNVTKIH